MRDDSFEFGFLRENLGRRSSDYGVAAGSVTLRRGVTDRFTAELRGEVLRGQRTAGVGASFIAPMSLVLTVAGAASHGKSGSGQLLFFGVEHQSRHVGFGVRSQWTSASFTQLGLPSGQPVPRQQMIASFSAPLGAGGNFGMSFVRQLNRTQADNEILAANYSLRVGKSASLNFYGNAALSNARTRSLGITLVYAFDDGQSLAASRTTQSGAGQTLLEWQQGLPTGSGWGYRVVAGSGASGERAEAGVSLQTESGTYTVDAGRAQGTTSLRLNAGGGLAIIGGRARLARRIGDAFALVEVPDFPEVDVYLNNQFVARTDARGFAVLPRLLPYQENPVSIDPAKLPMDAEIDATRVDAVPYFRSGLALKFPIRRSAGALLTLILEDGMPMPLGAVVTFEGGKVEFPVAQRGEVYVTGVGAVNRLRAAWRGQTCALSVELPANVGPLPRIGPLKCIGVSR